MNSGSHGAEEPLAYLFKIVDGPTYSHEELEPTLRLLSQRFTGELWSYGSYEANLEFGRMRLRVIKDKSRHRIWNFIRFAVQVLRRASELRCPGDLKIVVTSYDPFKGGLLAWLVAKRAAGIFVCEVNGDYGDEDNFADVKSRAWKRLRLLQMRVLGSFTLKRAAAIRLLFPDQLKNFVAVRPGTVVRQFFALTFTDRFYPGREELFILSAGFPFRRKGVDLLVAAFMRLADRYPMWKLVLIGHQIPDRLRSAGIEHPRIEVLPGMPQDRLAEWVSRCSIFALASRSEAMGRVFLEAAAAGKCRVGTRVGGIPTVIQDGRDGLLVAKENIDELETALDTVMRNELLRIQLGATARARILDEFSGEAYLAHFEEMITAALRTSVQSTAVRGTKSP